MAYINVDEIFILDNTGLQVDMMTDLPFKDAGLTESQQAQARKNIGAGGTNPNLLDNWYFVGGGSQLGDGVFPINQRGQTSYGGGATTNVDRWWTQYDTATTLTSEGMRITGKWDVDQRLPQVLPNGTYTFSVNVVSLGSTGAVLQFLDENYQQLASAPLNNTGITSFTLTSDRIRGVGVNLAKPDGSGDITFASMKLEKGSISTLANDPVPDFGEELRKCQRYLYVWDIPAYFLTGCLAVAGDATNGSFVVNTPVSMAKSAITASIQGGLTVSAVGPIASIQWATAFGSSVYVAFTVSGTMVAGTMYPISSNSATKFILSCEL